jgi:D-alanyl-D-alanine dipeptidase
MQHSIRFFILVSILFLFASCIKPPVETGSNFKESDLVELIKLDSSFHLDIRYATINNFTGKVLYKQARAFLQKPAAQALVEINKELKAIGYGIIIFDGYRPWDVTLKFWQVTHGENRKFVADPRKGSRHNRGCAVDLSLYDLKTGKEVEMTGDYDEMSDRSYPNYTGGTEIQRKMRDFLRATMEAHGFTVYPYEWWHFDFNDWPNYRVQNIAFEDIK